MKNRFVFSFLVFLISGIISSPALAQDRYVDISDTCVLGSPCYTSIADAVVDASSGDVIYIFPGTYNEAVDLSGIAGNISIISVNAAGTPTPKTATVTSAGNAPLACFGGGMFRGNITVDGLILTNTNMSPSNDDECGLVFEDMAGKITLTNIEASSKSWDAIALYGITGNVELTDCVADKSFGDGISVTGCDGKVTITGCDASDNNANGFQLEAIEGPLKLTDCEGSDNDNNGFYLNDIQGTVRFTGCEAYRNFSDGFDIDDDIGIIGDLFLTNCVANDQKGGGDEDGFDLWVNGNVTIDGCTAKNNTQEGIDIEKCTGGTIADCLVQNNGGEGIDIDITGTAMDITFCQIIGNKIDGISIGEDMASESDVAISCCDIEGNGRGIVLYNNKLLSASAQNVWWGHETGPAHPLNPGGMGDKAFDSSRGETGAIDYTPWLTAPFNRQNCDGREQLYYPHVASDGRWETEICVINPDSASAEGTFIAYNNDGDAVSDKIDVSLGAHARKELTVGSEFSDPADIRYIIFKSDSENVIGYTKFYIDGLCRVAIPAISEITTGDLYVSHIASDDNWWTGVSLVNTMTMAKKLTIEFNDGSSRTVSLAGNEHRAFSIKSVIGNMPQAKIESAIIRNADGVIGLELFGSTSQLSGILLNNDTATDMYYPHITSTDQWWTGIVAYNPFDSFCTLTIKPYTAAGKELTVQTIDLNGYEKYVGNISQLGLPAESEWFQIKASNPVTGFELFGTSDNKLLAGYTVVNINSKEGIFAKIDQEGWTGIAFVNIGSSKATVELTAYDDSGSLLDTESLSVKAFAKIVDNPENLFDKNIDTATYISYSANRELVGFQLNGSSDNMMLDGLPGL